MQSAFEWAYASKPRGGGDDLPVYTTGEFGSGVRFFLTPSYGAAVQATARNSAWVEEGRQPGRPPLEPIMEWVEEKFGLTGKENRAVARSIAEKMVWRGVPEAAIVTGLVDPTTPQGAMVVRGVNIVLQNAINRIAVNAGFGKV